MIFSYWFIEFQKNPKTTTKIRLDDIIIPKSIIFEELRKYPTTNNDIPIKIIAKITLVNTIENVPFFLRLISIKLDQILTSFKNICLAINKRKLKIPT